jgi:hypothetical protein
LAVAKFVFSGSGIYLRLGAKEFFIGLDLGQRQDFSAQACVERYSGPARCYDLRHLERLNLNMSYPAVASHTRNLVAKTMCHGTTTLVIDATGVGAPVLDLLHASGVRPIAITITGGRKISGTGRLLGVPKRILIGTLVKLFGAGRVRIGAKIPYSTELIQELLNFQVRVNPRTRQESYAARGTQKHDDLVLALALAVWYAEHAATAQEVEIPAFG